MTGVYTDNQPDFTWLAPYESREFEQYWYPIRDIEAYEITAEMISVADDKIKNSDLRTYYGVGTPSPMPFKNDIVKNNLLSGYILKAFALRANGNADEADKYIELAEKISPYAFEIHAYRAIF